MLSVEEEDGSSSGLVDSVISSEMKRKAVYAMSMLQLYELLGKISTIDDSISDNIRDSHKIPESCNLWINHEVDRYSLYIYTSYVVLSFLFLFSVHI